MARLPSGRYLVQQLGSEVVLFEDGTERVISRFNPGFASEIMRALQAARDSGLSGEDVMMAHFWQGYFYAYASPAEQRIAQALDLIRKYGDTDGAHHKQWVLSQVTQLLSAGSQRLEDGGTVP